LEYAVETFDLTKVFRGRERGKSRSVTAVDHINLRVKKGELFGLLGPNGAGKTTLIKILCTIILPTSGTARVNGFDILKESDRVRESFGWLHGETGGRSLYWRLSAEDNLRFYAYLQNVPREVAERRIAALMEFFELTGERHKLVKEYSTGMKVRVMLSRALLPNPPILLMDEPTVGLDTIAAVETRNLLRALNRDLGKTVILTSHNMYEVEQLCQRVAIIREGRIIADASPSGLREMIREARAVEVSIRGPGNPDEFAQRLAKIPVVKRVLETRREENGSMIRLQVEDEYEAIPELAQRLRALGVKVTGIRQAELTLEDVFVRITRGEAQ